MRSEDEEGEAMGPAVSQRLNNRKIPTPYLKIRMRLSASKFVTSGKALGDRRTNKYEFSIQIVRTPREGLSTTCTTCRGKFDLHVHHDDEADAARERKSLLQPQPSGLRQ